VALALRRRSKKSGAEKGRSTALRCLISAVATTSRSAALYGSGRNKTASATVKIAVLAPMPSATVMIATNASVGLVRNVRAA
jgi:hypothetical protein